MSSNLLGYIQPDLQRMSIRKAFKKLTLTLTIWNYTKELPLNEIEKHLSQDKSTNYREKKNIVVHGMMLNDEQSVSVAREKQIFGYTNIMLHDDNEHTKGKELIFNDSFSHLKTLPQNPKIDF